jgi:CO dehydrogenase nickel-insertion accessory protein CooC1
MKKVAIIGSGNVGSTSIAIAELINNKNIQVVVIDNDKQTKLDEIITNKIIEIKAPELLPAPTYIEQKNKNIGKKKWQSPYKFHR